MLVFVKKELASKFFGSKRSTPITRMLYWSWSSSLEIQQRKQREVKKRANQQEVNMNDMNRAPHQMP